MCFFFCLLSVVMLTSSVLATPMAPMKKKRTRSRVYRKKSKASKKSAKFQKKITKLRRRRQGGGENGDRYSGGTTTKRIYARHIRKTLSRLDKQQSRSTWVAFDRLACNNGYQAVTAHGVGYGGTYPTVDPGTQIATDIKKVFFEYTGTAIGNKTRGIIVDRINQEIEFSCASDNVANLTLYSYVARRDGSISPQDAFSHGLTDTALKVRNAVGTSTIDNTLIGVTPFQSTPFCQSYKVLGTKSITLNPGKTFKMKNIFSIKKRLDGKFFENGELWKKGVSHGVLVVLKGNLVNELGQATAAEVQHGPAAVLMSIKETMIFKVDTTESRDTNMTFYNGANPTGLAQAVGYNPETGQVDTTMNGTV